ncbi:MAG: sensor histidine kinase [Ferruginibacter sp.]
MVFGMMMVVSDITEKKLLEQEMLNQKIQEQKMMTRAIILGEERERNKIGQELHDNISQILAGTKLYLGMARKNKSGGENIINESIELLDSAIEEIRALSKGKVTPMKKVDLHELLQTLIDRFNETTSIKTNFIYNGSGQLVEDDLKLNVYRIMQEQLNNIYKHSQATVVSILVAVSEKNIRVSVADDGKGFDVDSKKNGIGLVNMINRVASFNGTIDIESRPGNGCKIDINLPC